MPGRRKTDRFYVVYDSSDNVVAIGYPEEIMEQMGWLPATYHSRKSESRSGKAGKRYHFEVVTDD